ncbi:hypothetical protein [Dyadobacter sp. CY312]|uniref:hypothetical protein n=1 Tax=Dyadobacter sp. CY312 TaxID=2907303 RepID=UPI001F27CE8D|nr:hypothetical protein [Dyadobacter sp. CY312]MCE7039242.1 hypothetical protein [Dyadobacter sp. CY312]
MAKLTNLELYKYAQVKWDKSNSPHETPPDFKRRYEEARLEWMKLKFKDFEVTESVRSDLWPFIREKDFGSTKIVRFKDVAPDRLLYKTAVHGDYTFACNGKQTTYTLPIVPRTIDNMNAIGQDPWNQPDDTEPMYVEGNDGSGAYLEVHSTTVPQNLTVHYLKAPEPFGLLTDRNGFTEEEETQQYEIIDIAVKKYELSIENYGRFQGMAQEIQTSAI